ncbi:ubiquitin carboxyl-terminal hydrolase 9X [Prorops nasuta]|uniref:ubiquitin carboxyl-terminal hydrolase 9X n=1 Tax=Prorops nasuta TaxID=863751 RepID=UPI0034CD166B
MTIATRGQGVGIDPPDNQSTAQMHSPPGPQQLADAMSTLQLAENLQTDCSSDAVPLAEESDQQQQQQSNQQQQIQPQQHHLQQQQQGEPDFPVAKLNMLHEKISSPRWVVPVLPEQELECLLQASIELCKKGIDVQSEACQRFYREGLTISFTKILTDDAVNTWKLNIHNCIKANCERLVELCVWKLRDDWFPLLDLLAMVFNPSNKFHAFNATRISDIVPIGTDIKDEEYFARSPPDSRSPRGWLVDLINCFGNLDGFEILLSRFQSGRNLTVPVIYALIRPFGLCYELLTVHTIVKYLMPIVEIVPVILDNLTDEELKKEAKNESKNDAISAIIKAAKCLVSRVPHQEEMIKSLEILRLKMILRLLQISSFNGKMNALNEVNKVISSVSYQSRNTIVEEEEWLTAERMAKWIKENGVLEIVLRDSLHQPQYVEKLEKILRFIIKERALTLEDLDAVWAAQAGKHEAIVKNVHDLLAQLAWDFSPEQLDHLFECFQTNWKTANKKQRERLLELIRRLAEDDKDGVMAHKVLTLFWNLAHSDEVPTEIMDQALNAHVKILDYSCSQERDAQKTIWLDKCVEELKSGDKWVLPALKQIREICCLYESTPNIGHSQRTPHLHYRQEVIERLQNDHAVVILVTNSLRNYMDNVRQLVKKNPDLDPNTFMPDGRYNHIVQVQERLSFLRFLLKDGQLWLCAEQAVQIWQCLAEHGVFVSDREACFKWFSKLMGDEPDLDPTINKDFFQNNILQLDPTLLTESGIKCYERFFKAVNSKEGKLKLKRRTFLMDDVDLIGTDYLWRVVTNSPEEIASRGIELLKEVNTNLGPRLQSSVLAFHQTYIAECMDRLKAHYDTVSILSNMYQKGKEEGDEEISNNIKVEAMKMCRVMKVLQEYINECDIAFPRERKILPLHRAARGKHLSLIIRFANPGRNNVDDMEISTHSNDTLASLRRQILRRLKVSGVNVKLDLFVNGEALDPSDDRKRLSQIPLRDKMFLSAKCSQINSNMTSSPDSSSDSSTSSPHHTFDGSNFTTETNLPGVVMSQKSQNAIFFFKLADLGCSLQHAQLRDGARNILQLIPPDTVTVTRLQYLFGHKENDSKKNIYCNTVYTNVDTLFFEAGPSQVLYNLEVLYTLLMPAIDPMSDKAFEFQCNFINSGEAGVILEMLTKNKFLPNADETTKRSAYLTVLKLCKLLLTIVANVVVQVFEEAHQQPLSTTTTTTTTAVTTTTATTTTTTNNTAANVSENHNNRLPLNFRGPVAEMKHTLQNIPNQNTEHMLRSVAAKLAHHHLTMKILNEGSSESDKCRQLFMDALLWELPDLATIRAIIMLAWAASSGNLDNISASFQVLHAVHENNIKEQKSLDSNDVLVCKEALEVLTIALILNGSGLESLEETEMWRRFLIDLVLLSTSRTIRVAAAEQFFFIFTWRSNILYDTLVASTVSELISVLDTTVTQNAKQSHEYFQLLCKLLNYLLLSGSRNTTIKVKPWLETEIDWLKKVRDNVKELGESQVDEALLEGHLNLTKELVSFLPSNEKYELGSDENKGINLIKELVEDFVFPASRLMLQLRNTGELSASQACPVCTTPQSTSAAFDLLVGLCVGCVPNMKLLVTMLTDMFYSERDEPLVEWDYLPPVGLRPLKGFVGLKNAGATCYMNSVLQQLYMVESIRVGLLGAEGAANDLNEDFSGEERIEGEQTIEANDNDTNEEKCGADESRKEYNIGILKQVQAIFGHLAYSKLQYYIPRGLWKHFKLQGEPVNLREQQDAVEFFMSLVESLDEALKALGHEQIMGKILGGSYSDQKICKGCPHRYSKEEPFSVISVDIRNHSNLLDSLEQYVKGELLEGADAYHCDKCNKKVVTVKRLCVKKLPPILAIQLKRFEYDFERVCAIKFNDYFEFPRDLDMEPYTVSGLAKLEGEVIDCDYEESIKTTCTKYQLSGIVVHSGQASGGHYYSYILHRQNDGTAKWYKFDDGDVTECKMEEEEEMKSQCFGGDYLGEVFDHMIKRMSYRKQKRWWNAYMLFYTRLDVEENALMKSLNELSLYTKLGVMKMPPAIEYSVRKQNIKFMHNRNQFSAEYFQFIKKLVSCNPHSINRQNLNEKINPETEELAMLSVQLASRFLFYTGFHTKKTLRGNATDWHDIICYHLRSSKAVRLWFAHNVLFNHPHRFCEYLLSCPSTEVRTAFLKIFVFLAHISLQDGPCAPPSFNAPSILLDPTATLSDHLLHAVLLLLDREVADHGRHLPHYFSLFHTYASVGLVAKAQLLKLNVPVRFMLVAIDEGPGPQIKYQYPELTKLHQVVSMLICCCDVSSKAISSHADSGAAPLPNPYGDRAYLSEYLMPIQPQAADIIFNRTSYIKKLIEDANVTEDTIKLLQYCCWENPHLSRTVLSELLWQIGFAYTHELRHHTDLLLAMLLMEDSWQTHRIHNALKGVPEEREGLFETIQRNKNHYQKRAYQCIKCMVQLFTKCKPAHQLLYQSNDLNRKWVHAIEWLHEELEKRPYASTAPYTHAYNNWSPPAQSNDSTNGYVLERSNSAKKTLERAFELCPVDDPEVEETSEEFTDDTLKYQSRIRETYRNLIDEEGVIDRDEGERHVLYFLDKLRDMQQDEQPQPGPSPVHTPLVHQVRTRLVHQVHTPQNCESSQSTNQDP